MKRKKTTSEVADLIGINHQSVVNYARRHPDVMPAERLPSGDWLWSDEEIDRLNAARQQRRPITKQRP